MEIKPTARKHDVADADMRHAIENAIWVHYFDDYQIVVGPARDARLLEIGVNRAGEIFHAMPARPKYIKAR